MDITFWLEILLFVVLLGFSAFFSSSETSLFSLTERQLDQMRRDENPRIGLIERMLNEPRRLIITILIGNELVNVSASVISAALVIVLLGAENKFVNLFIMVPILLVVGEITPKTLAIRNNVAFATFQSRPIDAFAGLITPLRWIVRRIADFFITLVVGRERSRGNIVTEDMLRTLAQEAVGEGELDILEAKTIGQIFEFGDMKLEEVMTPRASIHYLPIEMSPSEMAGEIRRTRFSKIPVYDETRDNVLGILYARDLLGHDLDELAQTPDALRKLLRRPYFVPETKVEFDEEVAETLGGLLLHEYGELPAEGAVLEMEGIRFTIESVKDNRIHTAVVERIVEPAKPGARPAEGKGEQRPWTLLSPSSSWGSAWCWKASSPGRSSASSAPTR